MKVIPIAIAIVLVLAIPGATWAQNPPSKASVGSPETPAASTVAAASNEASEADGVVPIKAGAKAPYKGLLVPEERFVELLEAENKAREFAVRLKAAERTAELVEQVYLTKLEQAAIVRWYDSPSFNRWLGIFLGAGTTALAIWGAGELQK